MRVVGDPREWYQYGKDEINQLAVDHSDIEIFNLTLIYLFYQRKSNTPVSETARRYVIY